MRYKFLSFLLLILSLSACAPPVYFASGFQGQIIDAQTGQSLEKVIVVGLWAVGGIGFGDTGLSQRLRVYETITDGEGRFLIPAAVVSRNPFSRSPGKTLRCFKQGYLPKVLSLSETQIVELEMLPKTMSVEYQAVELSTLFNPMTDDYNSQDWKNYPRMLLAVSAEMQRLLSIGSNQWIVRPSIPDINNFSKEDKQFLEGFKGEI